VHQDKEQKKGKDKKSASGSSSSKKKQKENDSRNVQQLGLFDITLELPEDMRQQ
jgi:hypothetical protein